MRITHPARWLAVAGVGFLALMGHTVGHAQTTPLPSAYPRPGATLLFENARVLVWDIAWLKQQYPLHRHAYDLVGVYYTTGDRSIVSVDGSRRPVSTKAWETAFQKSGVTHVEEGTSDSPLRAVFVELKETSATEPADAASPPPMTGGIQRLDNERAIVWEFVPPPRAREHRHLHDAVVVSFEGSTPRVAFVAKGTVHDTDIPGGAERLYIFELK